MVDATTQTSNKFIENSTKAMSKVMQNLKDKEIKFFSILIIILLLLSTFYYIYHKLTLNNRNCLVLSDIYDSVPRLNSITTNGNYNEYGLRDFYVKSAYNSCSAGNFKNDFVNLCALKTCINQGVRFLDFEIYS